MWSLLIQRPTGKQFAGRTPSEERDLLDPRSCSMNQKSLLLFFCLTSLWLVVALAQTADPKQEEQLLTLAREIQAQQAQIADNQGKIEAKLAELGEAIRVARIYSKREK
jgi:hypothetical protein